MSLTPFGRTLRQIRIDRGLLLYDMAEDLRIGCVRLSRIETGKEPVPEGFVDLVRTTYGTSDDELKRLEATSDVVLVVPGGGGSRSSFLEEGVSRADCEPGDCAQSSSGNGPKPRRNSRGSAKRPECSGSDATEG